MNCPFCGKEMREGFIPANQHALKWYSADREEDVLLSETPWLVSKQARAFYCPDCQQVLLPVPQITPASQRLMEKLDVMTDKMEQAQQDWKSRWTEKKEEKKWNKRKGKDPWEW